MIIWWIWGWIAHYGAVRLDFGLNSDIGRQGGLHELEDFFDNGRNFDRRLKLLLHATEGKNLFHQGLCPETGMVDGLEFGIKRVGRIVDILHAQFGIAQHGA